METTFVVECDTEVVLVSTIASISARRIEHPAGKSRVVSQLMRSYEGAVGIIDEDPNSTQPPDIKRFKELEFSERHKIRILHDPQRNNRLVILCPRFEEWIIQAAREANVNMNQYNLSDDPVELHEIINIKTKRLHDLIEELNQTSPRVKALRAFIRE
jgi:hypothetical protein